MDKYLVELLQSLLILLAFLAALTVLWRRYRPQHWLKIALKTGAILFLLLGTVFMGFNTKEAYSWFKENKPRALTSLEGISLGDSRSDVLFKKGSPSRESQFKDGHRVLVFADDIYKERDGLLVSLNKDDRVSEIRHLCTRYLRVHGVSCGDAAPPPRLEDLGLSRVTREVKSGLNRLFVYPDLNTAFEGEKGKITAIAVIDREVLKRLDIPE